MSTINSDKITIDKAKCIEKFGDDIFEEVITDLIENTICTRIKQINEAYEKKDVNIIKFVAHTLKSTGMYLSVDLFLKLGEKIKDIIQDNADWEKLNEYKDKYLESLKSLYKECIDHYKDIQQGMGLEVKPEYLNRFNDNEEVLVENKEIKKEETDNPSIQIESVIDNNTQNEKEKEKEIIIKIDKERSQDNFGDDMFDEIITDLVEERYDDKRAEVLEGFQNQNASKIKGATHTVKTTSRYLFEEGFAQICQDMENWSSKDLSWEKLNENKDFFLRYFAAFYEACLEYYKEIKIAKGEPIKKEYLEKVKPSAVSSNLESSKDSKSSLVQIPIQLDLPNEDKVETIEEKNIQEAKKVASIALLPQIEIKINKTQTQEDYGEDMFDEIIFDFIEEKYDEKKKEITEGFLNDNAMKIKQATHTLKTTSRYLFEEGFALQCQQMENWSSKELNWEKLKENKDHYLRYMDAMYLACLKFYKEIKTERGEIVKQEYLDKVLDPNERVETKESDADSNNDKNEKSPEYTYNHFGNMSKRFSILSAIRPTTMIREVDEDKPEAEQSK